jgi:hypothetical protein
MGSNYDALQTEEIGAVFIAWAGGVPSLESSLGFIAGAPTVQDVAAGIVSVTLPAAGSIPNNRFLPTVTARGPLYAVVMFDDANSTNTLKQFRVFDAAGAPLDNIPLLIEFRRALTL